MRFLLKLDRDSMSEFVPTINFYQTTEPTHLPANTFAVIDRAEHVRIEELTEPNVQAWIIGDPVFPQGGRERLVKYLRERDFGKLIQEIPGHYRVFIHEKDKASVSLASALFGILPIMYASAGNSLVFSDDLGLLARHSGKKGLNKRFLLENILFYYPLFNQSALEGVSLLPSNSLATVTSHGLTIRKYANPAAWISTEPRPWKTSVGEISDLFLERVADYLPDEEYVHALTGGFDSRTLVSCALYHKKQFSTYSFGNEYSADSDIAETLSRKAGIVYNKILLNEKYVKNCSLEAGLHFIRRSSGTASFSRAHYLYAAQQLSGHARYMVTGNFGSEILRAAHNAGVMISPNLYRLYRSKDFKQAILSVRASSEAQWLNMDSFKEEWQSLEADLKSLPRFDPVYAGLSLNARFYIFVFEELFRKYFGAEMVSQFDLINNRTPFLDIAFIKQIMNTRLAGVYSDFFEHNPIKRFKGQMLYGTIITKAYPLFATVKTDKGYSPIDLIHKKGNVNILGAFIHKKLRKNREIQDPFSLIRSYLNNISFFEKIDPKSNCFNNKKIIHSLENRNYSDDLGVVLGQYYFFSSILPNIENT